MSPRAALQKNAPRDGKPGAGPRKRSAAGQELRAWSLVCVGWRLTPYPTYVYVPFVTPGSASEKRTPRRETWRRKNSGSGIRAEFTPKKTPVTPDATGVFSLLSFPLNGVRGSQSSSCGSSARRRHETR
ncbi:hypothetical protein FMK43_05645 [Klebsiella quasipneumoniae]|nr:hypothetical protein [Klebsiella quasipneumoniae]